MATVYWTNTASASTPWSTGGNWSGAAAPSTGDDVTVANSPSAIDSGLAQSAVTLATLAVPQTFTGSIGSSSAYLAISATAWRVGDPSNSPTQAPGSNRLKFDFGSNQFTGVVVNTSQASTDTYLEPLRILGTHASNKLYVLGGTVGIATTVPGETSTISELSVDGTTATANCSAGVTLTTARLKAGALNLKCAATTVKQDGGTLATTGSGAITTLTMTAGNATLNSTGTITTLEIYQGAVADFTGSSQARTVTTLKLHKGATVKYDPEVVTITNAIQIIDGGIGDVTITTPGVVNVTVAAA